MSCYDASEDDYDGTPPKIIEQQNRGDTEDWGSSRDGGSHPDSPLTATGKRKSSERDRQPESPGDRLEHDPSAWHREKHFRAHEPMDTDSPSSYPKHVVVPSPDAGEGYAYGGMSASYNESPHPNAKYPASTPVLSRESPGNMRGGYDQQSQYQPSHYQNHGHGHGYGHYGHDQGHEGYGNVGGQYYGETPPRQQRHYIPDMATPPQYGDGRSPDDVQLRPKRWVCDHCGVASFASYEEACAHEESCARRYHEYYEDGPNPPPPGSVPYYDRPPTSGHGSGNGGGSGLGALYHATQEVNGPPEPNRKPMWPTPRGGPPMQPITHKGPPHPPAPHPHHHPYHHHHPHPHPHPHHHPNPHMHNPYETPPRYGPYPGYDGREGPSPGYHQEHYYVQHTRRRLAMDTDRDSLSDRQCYVRSEMVEIFAATQKDVAARHSKGAQKLVVGQVGIRCVYCSHLRQRDRSERAVCYPSSISRIYQTVADMQRFHFEHCREVPDHIRTMYKSLKTTRPRGVGSPQTYWIQSAERMGLIDSPEGIRFRDSVQQHDPHQQAI